MTRGRSAGGPSGGESLAAVLVSLGAVPKARVEEVERFARGMTEDEVLAELLRNRGLVPEADLREALRIRRELNSPNPRRRALAAAELAERSAESVRGLAERVRAEVRRSRKSRTGSGYPAVAAAIAPRKT